MVISEQNHFPFKSDQLYEAQQNELCIFCKGEDGQTDGHAGLWRYLYYVPVIHEYLFKSYWRWI